MGRTLRQNLPGAAFHITARTQGKEPWFKEGGLYAPLSKIILEGVTSSDARLIAFTVMSNHFHIVLQQGRRPLGWIMQPIMRRAARCVQKRFRFRGHVFEREFRSHHCNTSTYLRRSIVYTHINAQRAGVCNAVDYPWTSHARYVMDENGIGVTGIEIAYILPLFGSAAGLSIQQLRAEYLEHVNWRLQKDAHDAAGHAFDIPEPEAAYGDVYFFEHFVSAGAPDRPRLKDLRDRAIDLLARIDPDMEIEQVRGSYGTRRTTQVRNELIAALVQAGYRGKSVADYLRISDATVSTIASKMRFVTS